MAPNIIVGPTLFDLEEIDLSGSRVDIATAFYSGAALNRISVRASRVNFYCRLNCRDLSEWISGHIAPDALRDFAFMLREAGAQVKIFVAPKAHAKVYVGDKGALVGSANLTMRGFGGGLEIVEKATTVEGRRALNKYVRSLELLPLDSLHKFVEQHKNEVILQRQRQPPVRDMLPTVKRDSIRRLGDYENFKRWLSMQPEAAAKVVLQRANGAGNLSGHIYRNFYGLRQFFIANPSYLRSFRVVDPDGYSLASDSGTEAEIKKFVKHHAVNESDFELDRWRTYLPTECGGRAGKHGGTIGNLNRMLPLISRYLYRRLR